MLRNDERVETRRRVKQRHADVFLAFAFGELVGAVDEHVDHAPVDFIQLFVAKRFVGHGSIPAI